jgi:hypothetical protein
MLATNEVDCRLVTNEFDCRLATNEVGCRLMRLIIGYLLTLHSGISMKINNL